MPASLAPPDASVFRPLSVGRFQIACRRALLGFGLLLVAGASDSLHASTLLLGSGTGHLVATASSYQYSNKESIHSVFDQVFDPSSTPSLSGTARASNFNLSGSSSGTYSFAGFDHSSLNGIENFSLSAFATGSGVYVIGDSNASAGATFTQPFVLAESAKVKLTDLGQYGNPSGVSFNSFDGAVGVTLQEWNNGAWTEVWNSSSVTGLHGYDAHGYWSPTTQLFDLPLAAGTYQLTESTYNATMLTQLSATPFGFATVPEPTALPLALVVMGMTVYHRRRRVG